MWGKSLEIASSGITVRYEGDTYRVHALRGNPYIIIREFDAVFHEMRERQMYLPNTFYTMVDTLIRLGVC